MANDRGWSRRDFVKTTLGGAAAAGIVGRPRPARAQKKTLRLATWSHFVPEFDKWFDGVYVKAWGEAHGTEVIVDPGGCRT